MLSGFPLPKFESWTYTSTHVPFHNHWPISTLLFASTYKLLSGSSSLATAPPSVLLLPIFSHRAIPLGCDQCQV